MNSGAPTRASSALTVWLIAEGETPRSEAAAEKLRLSATRRKASIPSSAPWGIVKSCFRSEEHTSELQSLVRNSYAAFCLKKKTVRRHQYTYYKISTTNAHS